MEFKSGRRSKSRRRRRSAGGGSARACAPSPPAAAAIVPNCEYLSEFYGRFMQIGRPSFAAASAARDRTAPAPIGRRRPALMTRVDADGRHRVRLRSHRPTGGGGGGGSRPYWSSAAAEESRRAAGATRRSLLTPAQLLIVG